MQRHPRQRCHELGVSVEFHCVFAFRSVDSYVPVLLGIGQLFCVRGPQNVHHPVVSLDLLEGSLGEDIPEPDSAVT